MRKLIMPILIIIFALVGLGYYLYSPREDVVSVPEVVVESEPIEPCPFTEQLLLAEINSVRDKDVSVSKLLDKYADERAVALNGEMDSHVGFRVIRDSGVFWGEFKGVGENLIGESYCPNSRDTVNSWMSSTLGHRETMLDSRYDRIGIGYYNGVVVTIYGDLQ